MTSKSKVDAKLFTLDFLWSSANKLKSDGGSAALGVVQSQLRQNCFKYARGGQIDCSSAVPQSEVCTFCGNPWAEGNFTFRILSHSLKMKQLKKKLLATSPDKMSKYQKNLLDLFYKRKDNVMEKTCSICQRAIKIGMNKPITHKEEEVASIASLETMSTATTESALTGSLKKKKRNSKKDRFSGLIPSAVLNARSQSLKEETRSQNDDSLILDTTLLSISEGKDETASPCRSLKRPLPPDHYTQPKKIRQSLPCPPKQLDVSLDSSVSSHIVASSNVSFIQEESLLDDSTCSTQKQQTNEKPRKLKKKKKNKLTMSNSYISFSDEAILNDELLTHESRLSKKNKQSNPSSRLSDESQNKITVSSRNLDRSLQVLPNSSEKKNKKKKRSSMVDFLKLF